jgi:hypothetical protein
MPIAIAGNQITFNDSTVQTSANVATEKLLFNTGALNFRNLLINGSMDIDQRNNGNEVTGITDLRYITDRFRLGGFNGAAYGTYSGVKSTNIVPSGFSSSLRVRTTAVATATTGSFWRDIVQFIEANNVTRLDWGTVNAKTCVLSFWVRSTLPGTYCVDISNTRQADGLEYSYLGTYTITNPNTWEYKSIVIPGPTAGTWRKGTADWGLTVRWVLGATSGLTGTPGVWGSYGSNWGFKNVTGGINLWSTLNAEIYITGAQFEIGTVPTPFEYRPFGLEFSLCQRYYEATGWYHDNAGNFTDSNYKVQINFKQNKRISTWSFVSSANVAVSIPDSNKNPGWGQVIISIAGFNEYAGQVLVDADM